MGRGTLLVRGTPVAAPPDPSTFLDADRQAYAVELAEKRLGRPLTEGEKRIDLVELDRTLAAGKARLVLAIDRERRRGARRLARAVERGRTPEMRLRMNTEIRRALRGLYAAGVAMARKEIRRAGLDPDHLPAAYAAASPVTLPTRLAPLEAGMATRLDELGRETERRLVVATDLSTASQSAIMRAVAQLPGVKAIAADYTTPPIYAGLGSVWDHLDSSAVSTSWTYTAVADAATCDPCGFLDGSSYPTWADIQGVLPDGGPYPGCDGGTRCRCRAVPEFDGGSIPAASPSSPSLPSTGEAPPISTAPRLPAPGAHADPFVAHAVHLRSDMWKLDLTAEEERAVSKYTGAAYQGMNAVLRGQSWSSELEGRSLLTSKDDAELLIGDLRDALAKAPALPDGTTLYRGMSAFSIDPALRAEWESLGNAAKWNLDNQASLIRDWLAKNAPVGSEISTSGGGFQSFSIDAGRAASWGGSGSNTVGVVYRVVDARSGGAAMRLSQVQVENEVIVSDAVRYRVVGVSEQAIPLTDTASGDRTIIVDLAEV